MPVTGSPSAARSRANVKVLRRRLFFSRDKHEILTREIILNLVLNALDLELEQGHVLKRFCRKRQVVDRIEPTVMDGACPDGIKTNGLFSLIPRDAKPIGRRVPTPSFRIAPVNEFNCPAHFSKRQQRTYVQRKPTAATAVEDANQDELAICRHARLGCIGAVESRFAHWRQRVFVRESGEDAARNSYASFLGNRRKIPDVEAQPSGVGIEFRNALASRDLKVVCVQVYAQDHGQVLVSHWRIGRRDARGDCRNVRREPTQA